MPHQTNRLPGLLLTDHYFTVPLDHAFPTGPTLTLFAREVVSRDREQDELPWLLFLQGGPGSGAPRPTSNSGWLKRVLQDYRLLLLDQRGTGLSSPVTHQSLAQFSTPQEQAAYLKHFRADAIVRDAETIRGQLLAKNERWSVLGQSYGGFCILTYLSLAADGLAEAFITGGLASLTQPADAVYRATYRTLSEKNQHYYDRYPGDISLVQRIVSHLQQYDVRLPNSGDRLSPRRLQQLGLAFGSSDGFEAVHYLLEEAFAPGIPADTLNYRFLHRFETWTSFETNPIYAILHEAIYCQETASNWAAEQVRSEFPEFEISPNQPVYFTGEMIYPWMFDEYRYLRPLKAAAQILATDPDWPRLYDPAVLQRNTVPAAAVIYYNDMYVDRVLSAETAHTVRGLKTWVTSEYEHNGLRADGDRILSRLIDMVKGNV